MVGASRMPIIEGMRIPPNTYRPFLGRRLSAPVRLIAACAAICTVPWISADSAHAGGHFELRPVRVELTHPQDIGSVEIGNRWTAPITIQAEVRSWSQETGRSVYEDSEALLVSPPMFVIEPGERQIVRIGLRQPAESDEEQAFRIFFTELPTARDDRPSTTTGVDFSLRIAIPVFVAPQLQREPPLQGVAKPWNSDDYKLSLTNPGNVHVQIRQIRCQGTPRNMPPLGQGVLGYLLPGATRQFTLPAHHPAVTRGHQECPLVAETDRGLRPVEIEHGIMGIGHR